MLQGAVKQHSVLSQVAAELLLSMSVAFKIPPLGVVPCPWDSIPFLILGRQEPG